MGNNVFQLPFDDLAEVDAEVKALAERKAVTEFMGIVTDWCEEHGADTSTKEFRHLAAVIMAQLQIILMKADK